MRIEISGSPQRAPGLQVIPEVPDHRLCHLEGRNGIGKSLAARLLELATGAQPYAGQPTAWSTLKEQLGPTSITVSRLPGGDVLRFDVAPDEWPALPERELGERFARVLLNGQPVSMARAEAMLRVRRIAGDETLVQTLARDLDERAVLAESLAERHVRPAATQWEERLEGLARLCGGVSRQELLDVWESLVVGKAGANRASLAYEEAAAFANLTSLAATAFDRLGRRRRDLPGQLAELQEADEALRHAESDLATASRDAQGVAVELSKTGALRAQMDVWERRRRIRHQALERESSRQRQLVSALALPTPPDRFELTTMVTDERSKLQAMVSRRDDLDKVKPLQQLALELEGPLARGSPALGGESIVFTPSSMTVDSLLAAVRARRSDLAGHPRADEVLQLERDIEVSNRRLHLLRTLLGQLDVTARKQVLVNQAARELESILGNLEQNQRGRYDEAQTRLDQARDRNVEAELRVRTARQQIAQVLEVSPQQPTTGPVPLDDGSAEDSTGGGVEDEEGEETEEAPSSLDVFYPDLTQDSAVALAREDDGRVLQSLAALEAVAGTGKVLPDLALLRSIATNPSAVLDASAMDALRGVHQAALAAEADASALEQEARHADSKATVAADECARVRLSARVALEQLTQPDGEWTDLGSAAQPLIEAAGLPSSGVDAYGDPLRDPPNPKELAAADALEAITAVAEAQLTAAFEVANRFATLSNFLGVTANRISPRPRAASPSTSEFHAPVGAPLTEWVELELAALLSAPELLSALFDDAERVKLTLRDLTLTWQPAGGATRKRPLEAFSSGQQVFAYTQANLSRLGRDRVSGQRTIVFLDEFGAFVARDRLGQLLNFVQREALGNVADQVVVMLPLSADYPVYDANSMSPRGSGEDQHWGRAEQLAERDYFAVPFGQDASA